MSLPVVMILIFIKIFNGGRKNEKQKRFIFVFYWFFCCGEFKIQKSNLTTERDGFTQKSNMQKNFSRRLWKLKYNK